MADLYPWLKALHVVAALVFVGGLLVATVVLDALRVVPGEAVARAARRWDRRVTTPAMFGVWALGLTLGLVGDWFGDLWLQLKLALVVFLSGVHGIQSGRLRRVASAGAVHRRSLAPLVLASVALIAILAVVKP